VVPITLASAAPMASSAVFRAGSRIDMAPIQFSNQVLLAAQLTFETVVRFHPYFLALLDFEGWLQIGRKSEK
jgi:inosine-uridine nucleoside N-ribohydrolase